MMRCLDLFCGAAGGWSLGLHRAGFETVAACEIDPWRRAVFGRNFPRARLYGDIRELTAARLDADGVARPWLVCGSPPCQDASTANSKGKGVDGPRTGLFFEAIRIVGELRPRWVAFENVPGLRARGYDRVQDGLEALGYTVRPLVVGAVHAGAPHRRNRVWIVANAPAVQRAPLPWSEPDGANEGVAADARSARHEPLAEGLGEADESARPHGHRQPVGRGQDAAVDADQAGLAQRQSLSGDDGEECAAAERDGFLAGYRHWNGGAPDLGRVDAGLPKGMARAALAAFGDAVLPQLTEAIGRAILSAEAALGHEARAAA